MKHLDTLAMKSLRFTDTYTQASHSSYADLCSLNSHYPLRSRAVHFYPRHAPYPRVRIYDVLNSLGYRTAIISSQNEKWGSMHNYLNSERLDHFLHAENFKGNTYVSENDLGFASFVRTNKLSGKIDDRLTISEVIKWIGDENKDPFFVYINLQNSHIPFPVPADFEKKFSPAEPDFPLYFADFPKDKIGEVKDFYSDSLRYVDAQIGRLLGFLKERGIMDDTIIVFTSDNGGSCMPGTPTKRPTSNFPLRASKGWNYEGGIRIPTFITWPGNIPAMKTDEPVITMDLYPTLLELTGCKQLPKQTVDGRSLVSLIHGKTKTLDRPFLAWWYPHANGHGTQPCQTILKDGWKLVHWMNQNETELYRLDDDVGERLSLIHI